MGLKIVFYTNELYSLTRHLIKRPPAKDIFGNISILGIILTLILYPMFVILDTLVLPFIFLHSLNIKKKSRMDLFLEEESGKISNFQIIH